MDPKKRMNLLKSESFSFHYEPDHETQPVAYLTKYDKVTHDFSVLTMEEIRELRSKELSDSDWRMTIDYPGTDQEMWTAYRSSLRAIPQDFSDVLSINWPSKP